MKNVLLTGAAQGIGRAIAETLLQHGDVKQFVVDKLESEFITQSKGENFVFFQQDIADRNGLASVIETLQSEQFDAIINDAGEVYLEAWDEMKMETWDRTFSVNVSAPLQIVHGLSDALKTGSAVVNVASVDGMFAAYDTVAYAASKAALINLTKSMAANLGPRNIRVNAVAPGWVETEMTKDTIPSESTYMTPLGRNASAQDIANAVEFLVSDKSSFISGEVITVDGGLTTVDYTLKKESES